MKILILTLLCVLSLNAFALYEQDDRKDLYEINNPELQKIASAMAYQIEFVELKGWTFNRFWTLVMEPFQARRICPDERYKEQLSMRTNCSGILVSPKHLLTAGNCITEHYCSNDLYYWMFNYDLKEDKPFNIKHRNTNFYKCEKIVKRYYDPNNAISYTLLELKKEVKGVEPVKLRQSGDLSPGEELIVLGHPQGLPLKIADNIQTYDQNDTHFLLNSDIAGSTRGAAIINAKSYELEGIMIHGTPNYAEVGANSCKNMPVYENNQAQELGIKAALFKDLVNDLNRL